MTAPSQRPASLRTAAAAPCIRGPALPAAPQVPRALDRLKLRKVINIWPVRFTLKADYETTSREFTYGLSCKVGSVGAVVQFGLN